MNFYDALTWVYWVMLFYFVVLITQNLFEAEGLSRKLLSAAILVPFVLRLFGIA
jgi:hypothetical protein